MLDLKLDLYLTNIMPYQPQFTISAPLLSLVEEIAVFGVKVHDARLVAVMRCSGITNLLTLNESDFRRYIGEGLSVMTPESYVGQQ